MKAQINFETRGITQLQDDDVRTWLKNVISHYKFEYSEINFTFYSDTELLEMNKTYLNHDFFTDIITFDNTINHTISADIAISVDRIKDNALQNKVDFSQELKRVMVHGILHCMGFLDKTDEQQVIMRNEEDKMLNMFHVEHLNEKDNV
jgi:rRNA maturation RNase YbeY